MLLAGCATPPNATNEAGSTAPLGTQALQADASGTSGAFTAPPAFDSAATPASGAHGASLADAKPLTDGAPNVAGFHQTGRASWYGRFFHGRRTANGERYDMHALTAAHRTLPLGSYVRVTNPENHRAVIVRINDRGPFVRGRIIDLSVAAAQMLHIKHAGTARVQIDGLSPQEAKIEQAEMLASNSESR